VDMGGDVFCLVRKKAIKNGNKSANGSQNFLVIIL
jgi:hypothetical protein